jgi:transglycosylase-like protein
MRRMLERISPVLLVSVAVGGFVIMSSLPATAESPAARLDRLHKARPSAAFGNPASVDNRLLVEDARLLADAITAGEPPPVNVSPPVVEDDPPAPQPTTWRPAAPSPGTCNGDVDCFLACTRAHESDTSGGYGAVSAGGTYHGAYQFQQDTWDAAVAGAGHGEYAGVPADQVPPEVQDAAAAQLYSESGNRPWGGRC